MEQKQLVERQRVIRTPAKHQEILDRLEQERFARQLRDLNQQYDALRGHLEEIQRATAEHYRNRMAIVESGQITPPATPPPSILKKAKGEKKGKRRG